MRQSPESRAKQAAAQIANGAWGDDAKVAKLHALWEDGLSGSEIGRRTGMSKNAVLGKAHRLGLPPRPSPIKRGDAPKKPRVTQRLPSKHVEIPMLASELTPETGEPSQRSPNRNLWGAFTKAGNRSPVSTLPGLVPVTAAMPVGPARTCQWIEGDPRIKPLRFCGAVSVGASFCREHYGRCYVRTARQEAA